MSDTADRDDLAALLAEHQIDGSNTNWYGCTCGTPLAWNGVLNTDSHRAHVASMVLGSDWLAGRDRANWNEGHAMCCDDTDCGGTYDGTPHRADRVDAEDGGR